MLKENGLETHLSYFSLRDKIGKKDSMNKVIESFFILLF